MTAVAVWAATKSWSLAIDVPPALIARNTISSCLKVVGLSTTRTPLDSSHSVIPSASFAVAFVTRPGAGSGWSSGCVLTVST
jgi:hypothetical protein